MCGMARRRPSSLSSAGVGHQQRIAAREQHVAHLGVLAQVGERGLDAPAERLELALAHQPAARAVAAVGGAGVERQQQHPVGVAVDEPLDHARMVLAAGIGHVARAHHQLLSRGTTWRRIGQRGSSGSISAANCGVTATENFPPASASPRRLRLGQPQQALELLGPGEAVAHLPAPVVPLRGIIGLVEERADVLAPGTLTATGANAGCFISISSVSTGLVERLGVKS